jgi:flavin reductase (DIM6/NTAB) family NADH-FMN oxidoreductase RutF
MKKIEWYEETVWLKTALSSGGAFVVTKDERGKANPMTIGWAQLGIVWSEPAMSVLVRESRYTHACITHSSTFSVCVPRPGDLKDALLLCGTKSGRDMDKAAEAGLTLAPAQTIDTPIIEACGLHYECEIIARTQQSRDDFTDRADKVLQTYYPKGDYHLIVLGRILDAYTT